MKTVQVDLPVDLVDAANLKRDNLSQETARLLALELFREEQVSLGRAAELCRTPLEVFMDFAAQHGVAPLRYSQKEQEEDRRSLEQLGM